ncbi:MAG TPA: DUF5302 domain-containing protein [Mycobacteriales bacterium]|nr:DUF5302 domain-containing protein [Mycobacteriales bacterium]
MTDDKSTPDTDPAADETRRRFEEALERKRHRAAHGDGPHGGGKSVTQHADMKRQRTFRRKSG